MLSCGIAVLHIHKSDQLRIGKRNYRSASEGTIDRHLQRVSHILSDFTISNGRSRILGRHINAKGTCNYAVVKRMNRALHILNDLSSGLEGFFAICFIVGGALCAGNRSIGIGRHRNRHSFVLWYSDGSFGFLNLIRHIIGALFSCVSVSGDAIHNAVHLNSSNHRYRFRLVGGITDGNSSLQFLLFGSNGEHLSGHSTQFAEHISRSGVLLL